MTMTAECDDQEEESDFFFFHDLDESLTDHTSRAGTDASTNSAITASVSRSAPTLRKYTSRDEKSGFKTKNGVISSFISLTPSLSHPVPAVMSPKLPLSAADFLNIIAPPSIIFSELDNMERLAIGRNSFIYKATYRSELVAVKVMLPGLELSAAVQAEFNLEQQLLATLNHPNIVRCLGCGQVDPLSKPGAAQRFTVLEWLEHSLEDLSPSAARRPSYSFPRVFAASSVTSFPTMLPVLLQISAVLRYLHEEVSHCDALGARTDGHLELTHRAVTPGHFRYNGTSPAAGGGLKLTSFMACHLTFLPRRKSRSSRSSSSVGGESCRLELCVAPNHPTTSLCYTPPEVALRLAISAKSDIYAFALLAWRLIKNRQPYLGLSKSDFMSRVVYKGNRPKLSLSWSPSFRLLLESCWQNDPAARPPMRVVYDNLILECRQINNICQSGVAS